MDGDAGAVELGVEGFVVFGPGIVFGRGGDGVDGHLGFGVEIVDQVDQDGFGGFGEDGGRSPEFGFAVVGRGRCAGGP